MCKLRIKPYALCPMPRYITCCGDGFSSRLYFFFLLLLLPVISPLLLFHSHFYCKRCAFTWFSIFNGGRFVLIKHIQKNSNHCLCDAVRKFLLVKQIFAIVFCIVISHIRHFAPSFFFFFVFHCLFVLIGFVWYREL